MLFSDEFASVLDEDLQDVEGSRRKRYGIAVSNQPPHGEIEAKWTESVDDCGCGRSRSSCARHRSVREEIRIHRRAVEHDSTLRTEDEKGQTRGVRRGIKRKQGRFAVSALLPCLASA